METQTQTQTQTQKKGLRWWHIPLAAGVLAAGTFQVWLPPLADALDGPNPSDDPAKARWVEQYAEPMFAEQMEWVTQQKVCMWFHQDPDDAVIEIALSMKENNVPVYTDALREYLQGFCDR